MTPAEVARPSAVVINADDLLDVLMVALRNECRTPGEQAALLRLASLVDNFMVSYTSWARDTWQQRPCEACGEPVALATIYGLAVCGLCGLADRERAL